MRWSLILSAFIATLSVQSLLSSALVTTQNEVILQKRIFGKGKQKDVKASSSTYRRNSFSHPYAYDFSGSSGGVTRQKIPKDQRQSLFSKIFKKKKYDADHIYEAQMYHNTLQHQGTSHGQLPHGLQDEARRIMNRPENMAPILPDVNRRKGQWVKSGLKGKSPSTSHGLTRSYSLNSYPSARDTAHELQHAFQRHGYGQQGPTFHDTLHNAMTHAGVLTPGQPSPPGSPPHYSQSNGRSSRQRTNSVYQAPAQPVIPVIPHRSQSTRQPTRQSARLRGQSVSYNQPASSSYQHPSHQTGPVIPQQYASGSRRSSSTRRKY